MEIEAARVVIRRSANCHGLRYHKVLCDEDAKTLTALSSVNMYDVKCNSECYEETITEWLRYEIKLITDLKQQQPLKFY